ncbi:MAG: DUF2807 domain-containing protein [Bacteroidales bacterium]|nr:DUF2807 domain-containing protein [Bacteroidales bacterium]
MRRMKAWAAAAVAAILTLQSCTFVKVNKNIRIEAESGDVVTKEFTVQSFSSMTFDLHADIRFELSETPYVKAKGAGNVLDNMIVDTDVDGRLWVRFADKHIRYKNLTIQVGTPSINELVFNGAVDFTNAGTITSDCLRIECNGAADIDIDGLKAENVTLVTNGASDIGIKDLESGSIDITVNGAGDIRLEGKSEKGKIEVNGAGDIDVKDFTCPELTANSNGIKRIRK